METKKTKNIQIQKVFSANLNSVHYKEDGLDYIAGLMFKNFFRDYYPDCKVNSTYLRFEIDGCEVTLDITFLHEDGNVDIVLDEDGYYEDCGITLKIADVADLFGFFPASSKDYKPSENSIINMMLNDYDKMIFRNNEHKHSCDNKNCDHGNCDYSPMFSHYSKIEALAEYIIVDDDDE